VVDQPLSNSFKLSSHTADGPMGGMVKRAEWQIPLHTPKIKKDTR